MGQRLLRFFTLILAAIGLSMGVAHVLELPPRMKYDAELYTAVTSTLYRMYGIVGAIAQIGSVLSVGMLCWLLRGRGTTFRLTLAALLALIASIVLWATIVQPVNSEWARALADPSTAPAVYIRLRPRWEYGHIAACIAWFVGFALLAWSVLVETTGELRSSAARE
jgi:hypothetical protein